MRRILHILTETNRELATSVIDSQKADKDVQVAVVEMTNGKVNYDELLDEIFAADSVQLW